MLLADLHVLVAGIGNGERKELHIGFGCRLDLGTASLYYLAQM